MEGEQLSQYVKTVLEGYGYTFNNIVKFNSNGLAQIVYQGITRKLLMWNANYPNIGQVADCMEPHDIVLLYAVVGDIIPHYKYYDIFVPSNMPVLERKHLHHQFFKQIMEYNSFYNLFEYGTGVLRLTLQPIPTETEQNEWNWNKLMGWLCPCEW